MSDRIGDPANGDWEAAPPGWYLYPEMADTIGYFDGEDWTEHVAPSLSDITPVSAGRPRESHILWLGYVTRLVLPIVGLFVGLTQINRTRHGVYMILLSLVLPILVAVFFLIIFAASALNALI